MMNFLTYITGFFSSFRGEDFLNFIPPFFYFELGGHLGWKSGSPDTFWKGAIQESFIGLPKHALSSFPPDISAC
jgi:hypothetical protein